MIINIYSQKELLKFNFLNWNLSRVHTSGLGQAWTWPRPGLGQARPVHTCVAKVWRPK